jgi:hypothetical protein
MASGKSMSDEYDVAETGLGYNYATQEATLRALPGGPELIAWFGFVPWFHDDEIERLDLVDRGVSKLIIRSSLYGDDVAPRACVVTFAMGEVVELSLEHFYLQNVIGDLHFRPAARHDGPIYGLMPADSDLEIVVTSSVGLEGRIRCRSIEVSFVEVVS